MGRLKDVKRPRDTFAINRLAERRTCRREAQLMGQAEKSSRSSTRKTPPNSDQSLSPPARGREKTRFVFWLFVSDARHTKTPYAILSVSLWKVAGASKANTEVRLCLFVVNELQERNKWGSSGGVYMPLLRGWIRTPPLRNVKWWVNTAPCLLSWKLCRKWFFEPAAKEVPRLIHCFNDLAMQCVVFTSNEYIALSIQWQDMNLGWISEPRLPSRIIINITGPAG